MNTYKTKLIDYINEGDFSGVQDEESGLLLRCSLFPVELYINLSRELAQHNYTYGTQAQLEWAISFLAEHHMDLINDPDLFTPADWLAHTSSLDPADRAVSHYY